MKIRNPQKRKQEARHRRRVRVRARVRGTAWRPRLAVFRSAKHIYTQLIDDDSGRTLAAASDHDVSPKGTGKINVAEAVGKIVAERARQAGIEEVVFDRGGFMYHGRVRAVAEGAREAGLKF